jgi:hypothetical protein
MKIFLITLLFTIFTLTTAMAVPPKGVKSKFYDFSEQLINGQVRKPTVIYMNHREKVKFKRLLSLKKSFMRQLFATNKNGVFK